MKMYSVHEGMNSNASWYQSIDSLGEQEFQKLKKFSLRTEKQVKDSIRLLEVSRIFEPEVPLSRIQTFLVDDARCLKDARAIVHSIADCSTEANCHPIEYLLSKTFASCYPLLTMKIVKKMSFQDATNHILSREAERLDASRLPIFPFSTTKPRRLQKKNEPCKDPSRDSWALHQPCVWFVEHDASFPLFLSLSLSRKQ